MEKGDNLTEPLYIDKTANLQIKTGKNISIFPRKKTTFFKLTHVSPLFSTYFHKYCVESHCHQKLQPVIHRK